MKIRNLIHLPGHKDSVLMLHGFPGEPVEDLNKEKNIDIAKQLNLEGYNVFLYHYEGLGLNRDGIFSFSSSASEAIEVAKIVIEKSKKRIIIIGHSWGGYLAILINSLLKEKIYKTILLSPFIFLPKRSQLKEILENLLCSIPHQMAKGVKSNNLTDDLLTLDFEYFKQKEQMLSELKNITILHAIEDHEVPLQSSKLLIECNPSITLLEVETDHGFKVSREANIELIKSLL